MRWRAGKSPAAGYAQAVLAAKAREEYVPAYQALQPFLESGQAGRETCIAAAGISMAAAQYDLAERVADLCLSIHPGCAELYHRRFLISISDALHARVSEIVQTSAQQVLEEAGPEKFIAALFEVLNTEIDTPSLLRAIELLPSNYLYNLEAAVFEALTLCISKAALQFLTAETREAGLEDLLRRTGTAVLRPLREHLARAEDLRPLRDIQIFLVHSMADICLGRLAEAEYYALLAVGTRPDLPAGYDALITRTFAPFIEDGDFPDAGARKTAIAIYKAKISRCGETAADNHELGMLYFSEYLEGDVGAESELPEQARQYADKALEIDHGFIPARLLSANIQIVSGDCRRAVAILEDIPEPEDAELAAMRLHNLGITRILAGKRAAGIADLRRALVLEPDNPYTRDALRELGLDPGEGEAR
jgi:tetratricopeptide (TPR) repeat protein